MNLKIGFWSQFKMLSDLILISALYLIFVFLAWNNLELKLIAVLSIPYFLMFFFPVLVLHLNYLNENVNISFVLEDRMITIKNGYDVFKYSSNDIKEVVFYMNGSRGTVKGTLAFSNYYYAKVEILDGSSFIITSLYSSKIDKILKDNFENVKITTKKVFYPMI